jgi:hypothetical protein
MRPRNFRFAAFLAIVLAFALPSVQVIQASARAMPATASTSAGVTGGALFGGTYPLTSEQGNLGRKLSIVRLYYMIGQKFTTPHIKQLMSAGTTVLASLDVPHSRGITYGSIAAGRQDTQIRTWLTEVEQDAVTYHVPAVYVAFEHEANSPANRPLGTPAQFIQAWDHMHALAARAHLNVGSGGRIRWALILEHLAYFPANMRPHWSLRLGMASDYWPGTANVDVVAADGYNRGGCRSHKSNSPTQAAVTPGSLFDPVLTFARLHGNKPVFLAEWASAAYPADPSWQAHFIGEMQSYVLANQRIHAVMYWDSHGFFGCSFAVNGNARSVAALAAMGRVLHGHLSR